MSDVDDATIECVGVPLEGFKPIGSREARESMAPWERSGGALAGREFSFVDAERERVSKGSTHRRTQPSRTFAARPVPRSSREIRLHESTSRSRASRAERQSLMHSRTNTAPNPSAESFIGRIERAHGARVPNTSDILQRAHSLLHRARQTDLDPSTAQQPSLDTTTLPSGALQDENSELSGRDDIRPKLLQCSSQRNRSRTGSSQSASALHNSDKAALDVLNASSSHRNGDWDHIAESRRHGSPVPQNEEAVARTESEHQQSAGAYTTASNDAIFSSSDHGGETYALVSALSQGEEERNLGLMECERSRADHIVDQSNLDVALARGSEKSLQRYRERIAKEAMEEDAEDKQSSNREDDDCGTGTSETVLEELRHHFAEGGDKDWSWMDRYRSHDDKYLPKAAANSAEHFAQSVNNGLGLNGIERDADGYVSDSEHVRKINGNENDLMHARDSPQSAKARLTEGDGSEESEGIGSETECRHISDHIQEPNALEGGCRRTGCFKYVDKGAQVDGRSTLEPIARRRHFARDLSFTEYEGDMHTHISDESKAANTAMKEHGKLRSEFRATDPPRCVKERRFQAISQKQQDRRAERKAESLARLREQVAPFSFYERDMQRRRERQEERRRAKREHINQLKKGAQRARDPPRSSLEPKMEALRQQAERRKEERRQAAIERLQQTVPPERVRPDSAPSDRSSRSRSQRARRPQFVRSFTAKPIPNFDDLHARSESELSARKATRPPTTPEPFKTAVRPKQSGCPRLKDQKDDRLFLDQRQSSDRSKTPQRKPPPPEIYSRPKSAPLTKAQALRSSEVEKRFGPFDYETSRKQREKEEQERREHERKLRERARANASARMPASCATGSAQKQQPAVDIPDAPRQHVQSRHRQAVEKARASVEEILASHALYECIDDLQSGSR